MLDKLLQSLTDIKRQAEDLQDRIAQLSGRLSDLEGQICAYAAEEAEKVAEDDGEAAEGDTLADSQGERKPDAEAATEEAAEKPQMTAEAEEESMGKATEPDAAAIDIAVDGLIDVLGEAEPAYAAAQSDATGAAKPTAESEAETTAESEAETTTESEAELNTEEEAEPAYATAQGDAAGAEPTAESEAETTTESEAATAKDEVIDIIIDPSLEDLTRTETPLRQGHTDKKAETAAPVSSINEAMSGKKKAVLDVLEKRQAWRTDMPGTSVHNIISAISLNDRASFINKLFGGDALEFRATIDKINGMSSTDEAVEFITGKYPNWKMDSDEVYRFMMAVRRKLR